MKQPNVKETSHDSFGQGFFLHFEWIPLALSLPPFCTQAHVSLPCLLLERIAHWELVFFFLGNFIASREARNFQDKILDESHKLIVKGQENTKHVLSLKLKTCGLPLYIFYMLTTKLTDASRDNFNNIYDVLSSWHVIYLLKSELDMILTLSQEIRSFWRIFVRIGM